VLEGLPKTNLRREVLRFANLTHLAVFAAKKGLRMDEVTDVIAFARDDVTKELMQDTFERKARLGNKFGLESRFSNGDWPVFYSAIGRKTAEEESSHHYGRKAAGGAHRPVYYSVVCCTFEGETTDLQLKLAEWPELISDHYAFCTGLGKEAHDMSLAGFLAPSARNPGGTTVPAFFASALSNPVIEATACLTYDMETTAVAVEFKELR
jgi:hypothetical protein